MWAEKIFLVELVELVVVVELISYTAKQSRDPALFSPLLRLLREYQDQCSYHLFALLLVGK